MMSCHDYEGVMSYAQPFK